MPVAFNTSFSADAMPPPLALRTCWCGLLACASMRALSAACNHFFQKLPHEVVVFVNDGMRDVFPRRQKLWGPGHRRRLTFAERRVIWVALLFHATQDSDSFDTSGNRAIVFQLP